MITTSLTLLSFCYYFVIIVAVFVIDNRIIIVIKVQQIIYNKRNSLEQYLTRVTLTAEGSQYISVDIAQM